MHRCGKLQLLERITDIDGWMHNELAPGYGRQESALLENMLQFTCIYWKACGTGKNQIPRFQLAIMDGIEVTRGLEGTKGEILQGALFWLCKMYLLSAGKRWRCGLCRPAG